MPTTTMMSRIKLKVFGHTGVGKSTLVDSLKCGYFGSFFRKTRLNTSNSVTPIKQKGEHFSRHAYHICSSVFMYTQYKLFSGQDNGLMRQHSLPNELSYNITNEKYTKGIDIQQITISSNYLYPVFHCTFIIF